MEISVPVPPVQLPQEQGSGDVFTTDAANSSEHQGLESWTLPGVTPLGQCCLYDLQCLHL